MRIVSLISSATEILFAIGLGDRVVAVSHECDYPPAANNLPRVTRSNIDSGQPSDHIDSQVRELIVAGASLYELDGERIGELHPDLIITQSQCDVCAVRHDDVLNLVAIDSRLRNTEVLALNPMSLGDVFSDVLRIGSAARVRRAAENYVASLRKRVAVVADRTAQIQALERPRTVCIEWIEPLMLASNWTPELIELAGGRNGMTRAGEHSTYSSWSELTHYDPEVMVISPCGFDLDRSIQEARRLPQLDGWNTISAVKSGRIFVVDGSAYLNRSGPRLVDSLEILAYLLQPQAFEHLQTLLPCNAYRAALL